MLLVLKKDHILLGALMVLLALMVCILGLSNFSRVANTTTPQSLTVILDAGHGGEDPGAVSLYSGIKEKDVNLLIVNKVAELLKKDGVNVLFTRDKDELKYPAGTTSETAMRKADLNNRKLMIDNSTANFCVSVHLNSLPKSQAKWFGAQCFYPHNSEESKAIANMIQTSIKKSADPANTRLALVRGKANELPIVIFKNLVKPTCIVESGFLSNPEDDKRLATNEYQDKMAQAIKDGIMTYWAQHTNSTQPSPPNPTVK